MGVDTENTKTYSIEELNDQLQSTLIEISVRIDNIYNKMMLGQFFYEDEELVKLNYQKISLIKKISDLESI